MTAWTELDLEAAASQLDEVRSALAPLVTNQMLGTVDDVTAGAILILLRSIDSRLSEIETKIADYEPLIEMVKSRAERGTWRSRFGGATDGR